MTVCSGDYSKLDHPEIVSVLFHPRQEPTVPAANILDLLVEVGAGDRIGCRVHPAGPEDPNILFFHGNGETVFDYDEIGPMYTGLGLNFIAASYRGYGNSTGEPSATAMMQDSHLILQAVKAWLAKEKRTGPIFLMGRSLGSAAVIELAEVYQEQIAGLIIESGFASTSELLLTLGIDLSAHTLQETQGFNNLAKMARITTPTFILHGQKDELIPLANGGMLHAVCEAHSKEFQVVPGAGHNDIMSRAGRLYFTEIQRFVNKISGRSRARRRR